MRSCHPIPASEIETMQGRHGVVFDEECDEDEEPAADQLTALKHLADTNRAPSPDVNLWGPHNQRTSKRAALAAAT